MRNAGARRRHPAPPLPHNPLMNGSDDDGGGAAAAGNRRMTILSAWRRPILLAAAAFAATAAAVLCLAAVPFVAVERGASASPSHQNAALEGSLGVSVSADAPRSPPKVPAREEQQQHVSAHYEEEGQGPAQISAPEPIANSKEVHDEGATRRIVGDSNEAEASAEASSAETKDRPEELPGGDNEQDKFHLVFSTGCSAFQNWQAYVFFHRAMVVRQPGFVTRIVSGCTPEEQRGMQATFEEQIATMATMAAAETGDTTGSSSSSGGGGASSSGFRIHFTPDFSKVKEGESYQYFNKPFGVKHWMETVLGYNNNEKNENDGTIVVLLDPDELLLRPFARNDFSDGRWVRRSQQRRPEEGGDPDPQRTPRWTRVEFGRPIGQMYGYELQWKHKINMTLLVPPDGPTSPVDEMSDGEAKEGYVVGPPILITARDLYRVVTQWTQFAPLVHDQYPHLLAEMFAYSLASAHLRLSHQTSTSLMVSDVTAPLHMEDWSYMEKLDTSKLCRHDTATHRDSAAVSDDPIPHVLHYCQDYGVGHWFFSKYHFPRDFLSCEHPLFRIPPADLAEAALRSNLSHYVIPNGGGNAVFKPRAEVVRNAFGACTLLRAINDAAAHFKSRHCPAGSANLNEVYTFHSSDVFPAVVA